MPVHGKTMNLATGFCVIAFTAIYLGVSPPVAVAGEGVGRTDAQASRLYPVWSQVGRPLRRTKHGFITADGNIAIPLRYDSVGEFSNGLAWVEVNGRYGYIDQQGAFVIKPRYLRARSFSGQAAPVEVASKSRHRRWTFVNSDGEELTSRMFMDARAFAQGVAPVLPTPSSDGGESAWQYVDMKGDTVIKGPFYFATVFADGLAAVDQSNGLMSSDWVYIDVRGDVVIDGDFEDPQPFADGLAAVRMEDGWAYINREGEVVISGEYWQAGPFVNGLASVWKEKMQFELIDKTGEVQWRPSLKDLVESAVLYPDNVVRLEMRRSDGIPYQLYYNEKRRVIWDSRAQKRGREGARAEQGSGVFD
jgi:hypothetical protein